MGNCSSTQAVPAAAETALPEVKQSVTTTTNKNLPPPTTSGQQKAQSRISRNAHGKLQKRASQQSFFHDKRTSRLSAINLASVLEEYKSADPDKYVCTEFQFNGNFSTATKGRMEEVKGQTIETGLTQFKENPQQYIAMMYPTIMLKEKWPKEDCEYKVLHRTGTTGLVPKGVTPNGQVTLVVQNYQPLPPYPKNELPKEFRDKYTDKMTHKGRPLKTLLPGRGMGLMDAPNLKIIGDVDPSDIDQGQIGDCWLLSGIASLAEFDGAVRRLFRKTKQLDQMPFDDLKKPNTYTITLWDLKTWKEVDIVIDERLCVQSDGKTLLGAKPSDDGELWVSYLEKAVAAHCGGWDKLEGGNCCHAWAILTGCKEQYIIEQKQKSGNAAFYCFGRYDPTKKQWMNYANSPSDVKEATFEIAWPKLNGVGGEEGGITADQLFERMCAWDDENYLIACSTKGFSDKNTTDGMVDNHAYSVVDVRDNVAGTGMDLIQVRNPWGKGSIENGMFGNRGAGWRQYPQIKKELQPVFADDGIFWMTKEEFFKYCATIYLGASNLSRFLKPGAKRHAS